jgi:hypothetical protein
MDENTKKTFDTLAFAREYGSVGKPYLLSFQPTLSPSPVLKLPVFHVRIVYETYSLFGM